jgi:hypothetical protein
MINTFIVVRLLKIILYLNTLNTLYYPIYAVYYPFKYIVYRPIKGLLWSRYEKQEPCKPFIATIKKAPDFTEWDIISL